MNVSGERTKSLWMNVSVAPDAPRLRGRHRCDVAIVGSGIAGLSLAYELMSAGRSVIVVDRGPIAGGMTSRTTAHLAPICDDAISALIDVRGEEIATLFQRSQEAAVDRIETIVDELGIRCDFRRVDAFLFPAMGVALEEARQERDKEHEAARTTRVAAERVKGVPFNGFENAPVLRYPRQATFHPLKYLKGLAGSIREAGGVLFADSPVNKVEESTGSVRVLVAGGGEIEAANAVFATNAPVSNRLALHSKMAPYRTYAMAFTIRRGILPDALYWDTADPYHYVRLQPGRGSTDYLIAGGADHKTGEADDGDVRFEAIEAWMRALLPELGREVARWSGQVLDTIDYCGFIGRDPGTANVFVATGDSGQGITHGALAGILLRDLILNAPNPWVSVYDPSRQTPSGIVNYVRENLSTIRNLADYLLPGSLQSLDELKPGQGGILRDGPRLIAACRDERGGLHTHIAACTHLGCHVNWNSTEQCWDCTCHGSQFAPDGEVLNGPAISPLKPAHPTS
jgi:glycine/D-amino acid oxidase-like deaminating enzyme/nitrite reductase/ring-hydroxylating ferredoxin subunit